MTRPRRNSARAHRAGFRDGDAEHRAPASVAGPENRSNREGPVTGENDLTRAFAQAARLFTAWLPPGAEEESSASARARASTGGPAGLTAPDAVQFISQAWLSYMTSGFRYWSHLADAWARTLPLLVRTVAESSGAAHRETQAALIDQLRARFRELAEYPAHEARLLQAELDRIASAMGPAGAGDPGEPHWRRWETKP